MHRHKAGAEMSTNILEDLLEIIPFAAEVKRNPRTVRRWIDQPDGLPYTKLGNRILIHLPTAREWIMGRMQNVGRERPRKNIRRVSKRRAIEPVRARKQHDSEQQIP
jgi:hypothetical protein